MLDINTAVQKFSSLIQARSNSRTITSLEGNLVNSPLRVIGELMLNKFANPVGYIITNEIENLYNAFLNKDEDQIFNCLNRIIRVRAVQDFTPSAAIYFVLELKDIIKDEIDWEAYSKDEREDLDKRINSLLLKAFDIYEQCRYKLYELRVNEVRDQVSGLLKMANLVYEVPDMTSK